MKTLIRIAATTVFAATVIAMVAGPAAGHQLDHAQITCASVTGSFHDFGPQDHPIVWHVHVGTGAPQIVSAVESPPAFLGTGTATADITTLTNQLNGATATVTAFATWPGGQSATTSASVTCGVPVSVGGIVTPAPVSAAPASVAPASAAVPVPAAVHFTG
jgi:hypothetical protein